MEGITKKKLDELTYEVIRAAIEVHKIMGRGLLENVYQRCMFEELMNRKINFCTQLRIPVIYKSVTLDIDFRCDIFIEGCLVVELKAAKEINMNVFEAQLLNYMKLLRAPKGVLLNFNCSNIFNDGQKTYVNEYFRRLRED
jgi:GxxExxY protein